MEQFYSFLVNAGAVVVGGLITFLGTRYQLDRQLEAAKEARAEERAAARAEREEERDQAARLRIEERAEAARLTEEQRQETRRREAWERDADVKRGVVLDLAHVYGQLVPGANGFGDSERFFSAMANANKVAAQAREVLPGLADAISSWATWVADGMYVPSDDPYVSRIPYVGLAMIAHQWLHNPDEAETNFAKGMRCRFDDETGAVSLYPSSEPSND